VQVKNLLKKNAVTVDDRNHEVTKVIGTPFGLFSGMLCRHEAASLLKLAELGFKSAPKLISLSGSSFTMAMIAGESLGDRLFIDEPLFVRVLDVVHQLHDLGFAHGNLRPNNILITDKSEPVLIDFETCCQRLNPLFFLARFSDLVRLRLLCQLRVVPFNKDRMRAMFPEYVNLAMFIVTPVDRFLSMLSSIKKRWRKSRKVSAEQRDSSPLTGE
jgi:serine/threonine protein kinase